MSVAALPPAEQDLPEAKEAVRVGLRAHRRTMPGRARETAAEHLAQRVGDLPEVRAARCVAAYVARPTEPGTVPLLARLAARGTRVLLPALGSGLQRDWAWLTTPDELAVRAPGRPPEPPGPSLGADALAEADVVVVPALAVDSTGTRLGQGGGWYDRVLAHARPDALVVAMVFADEVLDAARRPLPREPHDRAVDVVVTPAGTTRFSRPKVAG